MRDKPLIFVVAGEASGDALGARLMKAMKRQSNNHVDFIGIGGPMMSAEGLNSLFPMEELSLMGIFEILPHIRQLRKRVLQAASVVNDQKPDAVVTIDSPGFAHAFIKRVEVKTTKIHYVAPSVWAWKPKRVFKFKEHYDHILALLPFEPPYFEKVGLPCHFVGHSILESGADQGDGASFRHRFSIPEKAKLLSVLPGSRKGEVTRLLPVFAEAVSKLVDDIPKLHCVIPAVPHLHDHIIESTTEWPCPVLVIPAKDQKLKYDSMAASNAALAASGTVALEMAMAEVPTIIAYKISPLTHFLVRRFIKVDFGHLLNILANHMIVPEFIQRHCKAKNLVRALNEILEDGKGKLQIIELKQELKKLSVDGSLPSEVAARAVLSIIQKRN
ncbi:lipid-A-disaccharide synthase [Curvivirga aplysinae]|uniref:lipid-A-disaccharide synthase n=1 Tax=Curvivirga aplysinae TaxID=2529852 RepID=UPI0012BB5B22|nr:lipid-A-disaccharide synthase [Curvivirga aplysinae]MTI09108.1 lipid-A-disaccharide synthase [Curvivirga aplysinae]